MRLRRTIRQKEMEQGHNLEAWKDHQRYETEQDSAGIEWRKDTAKYAPSSQLEESRNKGNIQHVVSRCMDANRALLSQGKIYVRGDSKVFRFVNGKSESLFLQRKNPRRIAWTVLFRRQHRKGISEVRTTQLRCPKRFLPSPLSLFVLASMMENDEGHYFVQVYISNADKG